MKNHENDENSRKIKNKTCRNGPIRKQKKKPPRRENVASALGTEGNQKKTKKQKKRFFFFCLLLRATPTQPFKQSTAEILSQARPKARIFAVDCLKGWEGVIPRPPEPEPNQII